MRVSARYRDHNTDLSANFVPAAGSAILLAFAHVHPELWFISLFALVPFLWRLNRVSLKGAISLGVILATTYVFATSTSDLLFAPKTFLFKLFALNVAFALFGLAINRVRRLLGFDPLFIALLWFPIEYVLIHYAHLGAIFLISNSGSSLIIGFYSLFGILLGSLAIVLGNSLFLLILQHVGQWISSCSEFLTGSDNNPRSVFDEVTLERRWYCFPQPRSPPQSGPCL